jgi:hypothetical protein
MNIVHFLYKWDQISPFQDLGHIEKEMTTEAIKLGKNSSDFLIQMLFHIENEHTNFIEIYYEFIFIYYKQYKRYFKIAINNNLKKYMNRIAFLNLLNEVPLGHNLTKIIDIAYFSKQSNEWKIAFVGAIGILAKKDNVKFLKSCIQNESNKGVCKEIKIAIHNSSL